MEDLLPVFLPVVVYWILSAIYEFILCPGEENQLFFEEEEAKNVPTPKQVILGTLLNQSMQMALALFYFVLLGNGKEKPKEPKGWFQIAGQVSTAMLSLDAWEYFWHRLLHENKFLFRNFHAMHHRLIVPYAYGAQYNHVGEAFGGQLIGSAIAMAISGMSPVTSALFFCLLTLKTIDDHCCKWFPSRHPFHRFLHNNTAFHTLHHQIHGFKCNYSSHFLVTWDMLLGTYRPVTVEKEGAGFVIQTWKDD
ncbi:sphinganine C4-monooxygenase 1-like [Wolffia australiana]